MKTKLNNNENQTANNAATENRSVEREREREKERIGKRAREDEGREQQQNILFSGRNKRILSV